MRKKLIVLRWLSAGGEVLEKSMTPAEGRALGEKMMALGGNEGIRGWYTARLVEMFGRFEAHVLEGVNVHLVQEAEGQAAEAR